MTTTNGRQEFNYLRDTKLNGKGPMSDQCQTPPYALAPLIQYLPPRKILWESSLGQGYLAGGLRGRGYSVVGSDLMLGQDFLFWEPEAWDIQVTNPPYSQIYKWLLRSYALSKPFALLCKVDLMGNLTSQKLFSMYGIDIILLSRRIAFKMPNVGWKSRPPFPVAWYTWGLLPESENKWTIRVGEIPLLEKNAFIKLANEESL